MDTRWTLVEDAARGEPGARDAFAQAYLPIVRAYLAARWEGRPWIGQLDDAAQDVFLDCLKDGGALTRVSREGPGRFRTWLYRVTLNVARRHEERRARGHEREQPLPDEGPEPSDDEPALSLVFDRAWAREMIRRAVVRQREAARDEGRRRRVEILELRFGEGLPIREIAKRLGAEAARVHHDYARAREEFKEALRLEIQAQCSGSAADIERECQALLARI